MKTILVLLLVAAAWAGGYGYGRWYARPKPAGPKTLYYVDRMHPAYKSDKPGIAPDCGMKLEPVYADQAPAAHERASEMPPGTVQISAEKQQLIGVAYGIAEFTAGSRTIRAVGKVAFDETRIARVHTKVEGWIDQVFVDFTGKLVEKGQPLFTLYSPEMLATQQEYLLALRAKEVMQHSAIEGMPDYSASLLEAARKRLALWDLSEAQFEEIARRKEPLKNITVYSPIAGYVTARNAFPNQKIMPDTDLYTIVDLSKVWVMADLFEYEAPLVKMGEAATVTLAYYPGKALRGWVNYIQPQVDPVTRTLKVRLELDNPENLLKPEMFADVVFQVVQASRLTVPSSAVLDSGRVKTVFVDHGEGRLEPVYVETGERLGDRVEILKGLKAGDRVVTSGNFLIDSESQLKSAAAGMSHQH
ncbi:MAG: efflux RND transporter periplasmic adaptor subunit [Acidobacteria bacterium]|nr:efflux RND transporter periplasmic adaptor subunit [Acidobacteriota bacterium]